MDDINNASSSKILSIITKSKNLAKFKKLNFIKINFFKIDFFIFKAKKAFIKELIVYYFDLKYYIKVKIYTFGYVIDTVFYQLTLN